MIEQLKNKFVSVFDCEPTVISRAPGRVELLGNHTDYNEGFVLSMAIDRFIFAAAAKATRDEQIGLFSNQQSAAPVFVKNISPSADIGWANYPLGVYAELKKRGFAVAPFNLAVHGDIPLGAGLSSSAALEVATALALCKLFNISIDAVELAKVCQLAEHTFAGSQCGLLDQFTSLFAKTNHVLFIDFRTLEYSTIPLNTQSVCCAITPCGVLHTLATSEYNIRKRECAKASLFFSKTNPTIKTLRDVSISQLTAAEKSIEPLLFKRALHIVGENNRVQQGLSALKQGDLKQFGRLLYQSHESSVRYFENSCNELDLLVEIASSIQGVYGSRLTGGGFGGATLTLLEKGSCSEFEQKITKEFKEKTGHSVNVLFASIADGALAPQSNYHR